jgi:hypothetical protein
MKLGDVKGEITVIAELGLRTDLRPKDTAQGPELAIELGQITETNGVSRRKGINILARRHSLSPNQVYDAIEKAKKLAK